jgi:energy-coupling factor transporter ATP-binding protein EcfA2
LLRRLVEICDTVRMRLSAEIAAMSSALPMLPSEYAATEAGRWYSQLTHATTEAAIDAKCDWQLRDDAALDVIARRVSETSPADKAKDLRKIKDRGLELATRLRTDREALGDAAFEALKQARRDADAKRRAVAEDAKKVFDNALDGVATESWRLLWSAARSYSEQEAYKGEPFPYLGQQARCVLCQQALGASGSARMAEFERFVEGALEASAASAERSFRDALEKLPERAGVNDVSLTKEVNIFYRQLAGRKEIFVSVLDKEKLPLLPVSVADKLESLSAKLEADAAALDQDAQEGQRAILRNQLREDKARQWLSQQRPAVLAEVRRLGRQRLLEIAQRLANTKWLSDTKSALAEVIVSQPFIDRFQQELKALRASRIRVAVERTKTTKAQVFHQIKIVGGKTPITTAQVLSEGEFRIVSLAAFLADVESRSSCSTFIFDDPVSSLDQEFEEATARRLVTLAKDRQVIVFTHRFSMLAYLESAAEEVGVDSSVITLRRETWGLGEPDGTGQDRHKNPDKAVNALRNERLSKARKIREEHGQGAYENEAKAICSDLRITLERLVEKVLLGGVVERFRGEVTTKNKLMSLAKINAEDCALIDRLMTKYSFQEHSQPDDRPVPVPDPDEIEGDLRAVASWYQEFKHRSPGDAQKMACPRGLVGGCRDEHP